VYENYAVPPYYDSMLAKLIVTGADRSAAIDLGRSALARFQVAGLETTVPFHAWLLQRPEFARAEVHTRWVEENLQAVTANWQVHMSAGRLRVYLAPCASVGFGSCDQGFSEIFLANQFNPFPLHRKATSKDWYVRPEIIP
jgi:pyruvate carboxylase